MSSSAAPATSYDPVALKAWSALSIVLALAFLGAFTFWHPLLHTGRVVWDLLRELSRPIL